MPLNNYQITNGLEVRHALKTGSNIFSSKSKKFVLGPNLNKNVKASNIELAIKNVLLQENDFSQMGIWFTLAIQQFAYKVIEYKKVKRA